MAVSKGLTGQRQRNRLSALYKLEGLKGPRATEGQRPPHRDTGLLSALVFQQHTRPQKSLSQLTPPFLLFFLNALCPNQLLYFSLSLSLVPLLSSSLSSESREAQSRALRA